MNLNQHSTNVLYTAIAITRLIEQAKTVTGKQTLMETAWVNGAPEVVVLTIGDEIEADWIKTHQMEHAYPLPVDARKMNEYQIAVVVEHILPALMSMPVGKSLIN